MEKILVVEDEKNISKLVRYNLEKAGFGCIATITAEDALDILNKESINLIILDIMLPKMDGVQFCKIIKQDKNFSHIPIVMLTAKGEEVDKVVGFELGVDDYVVKPFSPRELILRIKAILKRGTQKEETKAILSSHNIIVDSERHKVKVDKKEISLPLMEFKLLRTLIERKGRVQSRDRLLDDVWGVSAEVTTRTVDTHIKRLRKNLGKAGKLVETIRGIGYRIKEE